MTGTPITFQRFYQTFTWMGRWIPTNKPLSSPISLPCARA